MRRSDPETPLKLTFARMLVKPPQIVMRPQQTGRYTVVLSSGDTHCLGTGTYEISATRSP